jgi:hypothetical protein
MRDFLANQRCLTLLWLVQGQNPLTLFIVLISRERAQFEP